MVVCLGKNIQSEMEECVTNIDHEQNAKEGKCYEKICKGHYDHSGNTAHHFFAGAFRLEGWRISGMSE